MKITIKNSVIFFAINYVLLISLNLGIPTKSLSSSVNPTAAGILSFLYMSFDFLSTANLIAIIVGWVLSLLLYGLLMEMNYKKPFSLMFQQTIIVILTAVLFAKNAGAFYELNMRNIYIGGLISCCCFLLLYIPMFIRQQLDLNESEEKVTKIYEKRGYIAKCGGCGKEFQSNPELCSKCGEPLRGHVSETMES